MATNNIILAVPGADTSVDYTLPSNDSAQLSFSPSDIDGLKMDASGGLVISFSAGGEVTLKNFQSFIDNGNTLSLSDGTQVDPKLLFNALGGEATSPIPLGDITHIGVPQAGAQKDITLDAGKKYLFDFDLSETNGANVKDGQMVVDFKNGGKIVIANYETAMASETPPELSLASKTCVVTGDELITNIQDLANTGALEATALALKEKEEEEAAKRKAKIAAADMNGADDIGAGDQTGLGYEAGEVKQAAAEEIDDAVAEAKDAMNEIVLAEAEARKGNEIETASGEEALAAQLAAIETAAGGAAGGARNSGYGYRSSPGSDPFITNPDIGPIDPTQLGYRAPILTPSEYVAPEGSDPDTNPIAIRPDAKYIDETNLGAGPVSVSGELDIDYGADGPGGVAPNDTFGASGSLLGGNLTSNGDAITVSVEGNNYVGKTPDGQTVFELVINPQNGDYTFTQYQPVDHADGTNADDQIGLNFGVTARDGDGDPARTTIQIIIADDGPSASGASETIDETDLGPIVETGSITVDFGEDGPGRVETTGVATPSGSLDNGALTSNGVPVVIASTPTGYTGTANGVTVFTLVINAATGEYTYTQYKNLDHADNNNPNDIITLTFGTNVVDYDGDKAPANIVINIKDDAPTFQPPEDPENPEDPEEPVQGNPTPDHGLETVDETDLGPVIETGTLDADFGADAPGSYAFIPGAFGANGSLKGGELTHNGVPVVVSVVDGVYVGTAGGETIFTLELNTATGDYKFTLLDTLDHADATNPDDVITLHFGVSASDSEGESANGSIQINVKDDAPVANDDRINVGESQTATGNVTNNDVPGNDTPAIVTKVVFKGTSYDVPATGTVTIVGDYGTLKIGQNGAYTYTAISNNPDGTDKFIYTLKDYDGDIDTAKLEVCVSPKDDTPIIVKPAEECVDETNLKDGVITETGTVSANYFSDGPGTISGTGGFTSTGSKANGTLSHNGVPVNVTLTGNTYTGKAGDVTVFTLVVNPNGSYEFKLFEQLDHADATDPNDVINLNFGVKATDADGDSAQTVIVVKVLDDAPVANGETRGLDEGQTITGNVTDNDVPGQDTPATVTKVEFNGQSYTVPADGTSIVINGDEGKLTIDRTGAYTYTAKPNAGGADSFTYTLTDRDGDTDPAILKITVTDTDTCPVIIKPGTEKVDETNLKDGVITETGTITADFKDDGPGSFGGTGGFSSTGSKANNALTHNGTTVNVSMTGNTYTGKAGDITVFTLVVNANGSYTFKLFEQLDHADGSNPDDIINLHFGVKATDTDGDSDATTLTIQVKDDAPVANDDARSVTEKQTITGNVTNNDAPGQDTPATVTKVVFGSTSYDVPTSGQLTIVGAQGTLKIDKTGAYTYTAKNNADGIDSFTYTLTDRDGDSDPAILKITVTENDTCPVIVKPGDECIDETNLKDGVITETGTITADFKDDGPGSFGGTGSFTSSGSKANNALTHNGTTVNVSMTGNTYTGKAGDVTVFTLAVNTNGSYTFKLFEQLDHADGSNPDDIINLHFGVKATDTDGDSDATTLTIQVKDDAPDAKDDSRNASEGETITGNVTSNDVSGQDTPATVTKVTFEGTSYDVPASGQVTIPGDYGTLKIGQSGAYSYTAKSNNPDGTDKFTYTLKDRDGDTDTAKLEICVSPNDDTPIIVKPAVECVDETDLKSGVITEGGAVTANFFGDGPGTFAATGVFTSGGSKLGGALTHNGTIIDVTRTGNTYVGKAGSVTVFTLAIAANGSYSFKLYEQLDHANASDPNDIIELNFGVKAVDADGDSATTSITVQVKDDAPIAKDDVNNFALDARGADGNVVSGQNGGLGAKDVLSQDVANKVVSVAFGANKIDVPATGTTTITGEHGKLTIAADGSYSYKLFDSVKDKDAKTSTASFTAADVAGTASSVTKNGITIFAKNGADLTFVSNTGKGDGVGIAGHGSAKISDGEVLGITFGASVLSAEVALADISSKEVKTGFEYRVYTSGSTTPITGEVDFSSLRIVNGVAKYTFGETLTNGKEITKIEIYSSDEGACKQTDFVLDCVTACYPAKEICVEDKFVYTLQDRDGDKDTATLTVATASENDLVTGTNGANTLHGGSGHDKIVGLDGDDTIYGGVGNDLLIGGKGNDTLYGGTGADTFWYNAINEGVDRIKDFNKAEGDKLDLSNVIANFDPVTDAITDFVFASYTNGNTTISVNEHGTGGAAAATALAVIEGANVNVNDLFNNGSIVV